MGFFWALGGVLCGTLAALALGAIADYLNMRNVLPPEVAGWMFAPWLMAAGGFIGSIVSVSMYGRYLRDQQAKSAPQSSRPFASRGVAASSSRQSTTSSTTATGGKSAADVPGMPSFDFDAARAQSAAERKSIEGMQQGPKP